ncbi:MAG: TonB-dependent receptor [Gluconacetobacter liquefaciens]
MFRSYPHGLIRGGLMVMTALSPIPFASAIAAPDDQAAHRTSPHREKAPLRPSSAEERLEVRATRKPVGGGLMTGHTGTTAQSTVTKEAFDLLRPSANAATLVETVPGVIATTGDPTGLFDGGSISIRGFDRNLIGFTVDGVPMNDASTYDFVLTANNDSENYCNVVVTQAGSDPLSPQRGEIGGSMAYHTCAPTKARKAFIEQTGGSYDLVRTFARYNTGAMLDGRLTNYISFSRSTASVYDQDKGGILKYHGDLRSHLDLGAGNTIDLMAFRDYKYGSKNRNVTLAQYRAYGYDNGYGTDLDSFLGLNPTPVAGKAQTAVYANTGAAVPYTAHNLPYYGMVNTVGDRWLITLAGHFAPTPHTRLTVQPYYHHQYGGSTAETLLKEASSLHQAVDLNGDGDTKDAVVVNSFSQSSFDRIGNLLRLEQDIGPVTIEGGYWFERLFQHQSNPFQSINEDGTVDDILFSSAANLLQDATGRVLQNRLWKTDMTTHQLSIGATGRFFHDRLLVTLGTRWQQNARRFENLPSDQAQSYKWYAVERDFTRMMPSAGARYFITPNHQVFASISTGQRLPPNFVDQQLVDKKTGAIGAAPDISAETSVSMDWGYRFQHRWFNVQVTGFDIEFYNRIGLFANPFDPLAAATYANLGGTHNRGAELEIGTTPWRGFSFYGSATYTSAKMAADIPYPSGGTTVYLPTKGKQFYNTPPWIGVAQMTYRNGPVSGSLRVRYVGRSNTTLTNDQSAAPYATVDLSVGYHFPTVTLAEGIAMSAPKLQINVTNIFNKGYLTPTGGANPNSYNLAASGPGASTPTYTLGSPRAVSATFSAEF